MISKCTQHVSHTFYYLLLYYRIIQTKITYKFIIRISVCDRLYAAHNQQQPTRVQPKVMHDQRFSLLECHILYVVG